MNQKKIVLTRFPFTDLSSTKRRPAIVLTSKKSTSSDVIVAFISSVIPTTLEETHYILKTNHSDFPETGLHKDSIFKLDKLATLDSNIFTGEMGEVSDDLFDELIICLRKVFDL